MRCAGRPDAAEYHARHILVGRPGRRQKRSRRSSRRGGDFAKLGAEKNSKDPSGQEWRRPWLGSHSKPMVKPFSDAVAALQPGPDDGQAGARASSATRIIQLEESRVTSPPPVRRSEGSVRRGAGAAKEAAEVTWTGCARTRRRSRRRSEPSASPRPPLVADVDAGLIEADLPRGDRRHAPGERTHEDNALSRRQADPPAHTRSSPGNPARLGRGVDVLREPANRLAPTSPRIRTSARTPLLMKAGPAVDFGIVVNLTRSSSRPAPQRLGRFAPSITTIRGPRYRLKKIPRPGFRHQPGDLRRVEPLRIWLQLTTIGTMRKPLAKELLESRRPDPLHSITLPAASGTRPRRESRRPGFLGLGQLRPASAPGDDIARLLRHAPCHLAAERSDAIAGVIAAHALQRSQSEQTSSRSAALQSGGTRLLRRPVNAAGLSAPESLRDCAAAGRTCRRAPPRRGQRPALPGSQLHSHPEAPRPNRSGSRARWRWTRPRLECRARRGSGTAWSSCSSPAPSTRFFADFSPSRSRFANCSTVSL